MAETQKKILVIIDLNGTADQMWTVNQDNGEFNPNSRFGELLTQAKNRYSEVEERFGTKVEVRFGIITGGTGPNHPKKLFAAHPEIDFLMLMPMLEPDDFKPNSVTGVTAESTREYLKDASLIVINNSPQDAQGKKLAIAFFAQPRRPDLVLGAGFVRYQNGMTTEGLLQELDGEVAKFEGPKTSQSTPASDSLGAKPEPKTPGTSGPGGMA